MIRSDNQPSSLDKIISNMSPTNGKNNAYYIYFIHSAVFNSQKSLKSAKKIVKTAKICIIRNPVMGVFKILEKYNLRERWKQVSEILERWKQVFRNLREIFPKSSFQNLREIVISERWKQIPEILERWKQVPEIACNITHDYYSL